MILHVRFVQVMRHRYITVANFMTLVIQINVKEVEDQSVESWAEAIAQPAHASYHPLKTRNTHDINKRCIFICSHTNKADKKIINKQYASRLSVPEPILAYPHQHASKQRPRLQGMICSIWLRELQRPTSSCTAKKKH